MVRANANLGRKSRKAKTIAEIRSNTKQASTASSQVEELAESSNPSQDLDMSEHTYSLNTIEAFSEQLINAISELSSNMEGHELRNAIMTICDEDVQNRMNQFRTECTMAIPIPYTNRNPNYVVDWDRTRNLSGVFKNFVMVNNPGEGDCFYYSVAIYLLKNRKFVAALRLLAILAIVDNWPLFEYLVTNHVIQKEDGEIMTRMSELIFNISTLSKWATYGAVYATCIALGREIVINVRTNGGSTTMVFCEDGSIDFPVFLYLYNETHFETLIPSSLDIMPIRNTIHTARRGTYFENITAIRENMNRPVDIEPPEAPMNSTNEKDVEKEKSVLRSTQRTTINKDYYQRNKAKAKARYSQNREKIKEYYIQNKDKAKEYYIQNQDKAKESYAKNITQIKEKYQRDRDSILENYHNTKLCKYLPSNFLSDINVTRTEICEICHKCLFPGSVKSVTKAKVNADIPNFDNFSDPFWACHRCAENITRDKPVIPAQAHWNALDPQEVPDCIKKLTPIEVKLLSRLIVFMKIQKVKGRFGQYGIKGQAIVFEADTSEIGKQIVNRLPRRIQDIHEVIVVESKEGMKYHRQYVVNVENLKTALHWLVAENTLYKDLEAILDRPASDYDVYHITQEIKTLMPEPFCMWKTVTAKHDKIPFRLLGSKSHQLDPHRFPHNPEAAGRHGSTICIAALIFSEMKRMRYWNKDDMINMLSCGHKLYVTCEKLRFEDFDENGEIKLNLTIFNRSVEVTLTLIITDKPVDDIDDEILEFFEQNHEPVLLKCNNVPIAVVNEEKEYYIYDPNPRSKFGNPAAKGGQQILTCSSKFEKFMDLVKRSLKINSDTAKKKSRYEMISVSVTFIETNEPVAKRPLDKNEAHHMNEPKRLKTKPEQAEFFPMCADLKVQNISSDWNAGLIESISTTVLINTRNFCKTFFGSTDNLVFKLSEVIKPLYSAEFCKFELFCQSSTLCVLNQIEDVEINYTLSNILKHFCISHVPHDGNSFYKAVSKSSCGTDKLYNAMKCIVLKEIINEEQKQNGKLFSKMCQYGFAEHPFPSEANHLIRNLLSLIKNVIEEQVPATNSCFYAMCMGLKKRILIQTLDETFITITSLSVNFYNCPIVLQQDHYANQYLPILASFPHSPRLHEDQLMTEMDVQNVALSELFIAISVSKLHNIDNLREVIDKISTRNDAVNLDTDEDVDLDPEAIENENLMCSNCEDDADANRINESCINVSLLMENLVIDQEQLKEKVQPWRENQQQESASYNPFALSDCIDCDNCSLHEKISHQYCPTSKHFELLRSTHFQSYKSDGNKMIFRRFEELTQSYCIQRALVAIAFDKLQRQVNNWNSHVINYICLLAMEIPDTLIERIASVEEGQLMSQTVELAVTCITPQQTTWTLRHLFNSKMPNLKRGLILLFSTHRYGILRVDNLCYTLWKDVDGTFYLFNANIDENLSDSLVVLRTKHFESFVQTIAFLSYMSQLQFEANSQGTEAFDEVTLNIWCVQINAEDLQPFKEVNFDEEIHCVSSMLMPTDASVQRLNEYLDIDDDQNWEFEKEVPIVQLKRKTKRVAVKTHLEKKVEELVFFDKFPKGINGLNEERRPIKISPLDYFQTRTMGSDPRFWEIRYLFYALSETEKWKARLATGVCAKLSKGNEAERVNNLTACIHLVIRNLRGTNEYWRRKYLDLLELVKNLGPATAFLTLSSNDMQWKDVLRDILIKRAKLKNQPLSELDLSDEALDNLDYATRQELVEDFPQEISHHFDLRVKSMLKLLKNPKFLGYKMIAYWARIEFQQRGSPHLHMMIWYENFPDLDTPEGIAAIDSIVTCSIPDDPVLATKVKKYQSHFCKDKCTKNANQEKKRCKYNFPRPISSRTRVLDIDSVEALRNGGRLVILKRTDSEQFINDYVLPIFKVWDGNMDWSFIKTVGIVEYIAKYVSKSEPSKISEVMSKLIEELNEGRSRFHTILLKAVTSLLNNREVGACEAVYKMDHLPLTFSSHSVVFVNSCKPENRYRMIDVNTDDTEQNSFMTNIFDRYQNRPKTPAFDHLSLFEFASWYRPYYNKKVSNVGDEGDEIGNDESSQEDEAKNDNVTVKKRSKRNIITLLDKKSKICKRKSPCIVRGRYFSKNGDPEGYFYSLLVLHVPFRDEAELLKGYESAINAFEGKKHLLRPFSNNYTVKEFLDLSEALNELLLQLALKTYGNPAQNPQNPDDPPQNPGDILDDDFEIQNKNRGDDGPILFDYEKAKQNIDKKIRQLNVDQRYIFDIVARYIHDDLDKTTPKPKPLRMAIVGGAGTGKTMLQNVLSDYIEAMYKNSNNSNGRYILKTAPTGVAAYLMGGVTNHAGFYLPCDQCTNKDTGVRKLNPQRLEKVRGDWLNIKFIMSDEFSMEDNEMFKPKAQRIRELSNQEHDPDDPYAGLCILYFGDPLQLPSIAKRPFYRRVALPGVEFQGDPISLFLWDQFDYCELSVNMRQQNNSIFVDILNNLRFGDLTIEQLKILEDKLEVGELSGIFADTVATRIYSKNMDVKAHNHRVLQKIAKESNAKVYTITAIDELQSKKNQNIKVEHVTPDDVAQTAGLCKDLQLCVGARVMLIKNINVKKGLVNGSLGVIKEFVWPNFQLDQRHGENQLPDHVLVKFDQLEQPIKIMPKTVSFSAKKSAGIIDRTQIPLVLSWACTAHKLQGCTVESAVIDLGSSVFAPGQAYVMLSRVRSLDRLIICNYDPTKLTKEYANQEAIAEIIRLRNLPKYQEDNNNDNDRGPCRRL